MKAVLIPGDGIGKEISQSVVDITKAMNLDIEWVEYQAGAEYAVKTKEVFEPGLQQQHLLVQDLEVSMLL